MAGDFKSKDLLALPKPQIKFWIQGGIEVLAASLVKKNEKQSICIMNWYFGDKQAERNGLILGSLKKYGNTEPSAVIIALLEIDCGKIW